MKNRISGKLFKKTSVLMAALAVVSVARGQPELTFIDGGYAELCSSVAVNIDTVREVQITGSRLGVPSMEVCTMAIESGDSTPALRAASYNNRGVLWFGEANYEAALKDFDSAVALDNDLLQANVNRGYTLVALKRWQDSVVAFDKSLVVVEKTPAAGAIAETEKVYFSRGIAHEELGHIREAYFDYKKASELNPLWPDPQRELARFTVRK